MSYAKTQETDPGSGARRASGRRVYRKNSQFLCKNSHVFRKNSQGIALAYAFIVILIVIGIGLAFSRFRGFVVRTTNLASQEVNARAAAEAALAAVMAELQVNSRFKTHETARITNEQELVQNPNALPVFEFQTPVADIPSALKTQLNKEAMPGLSMSQVGNGVYAGEIGTGLSQWGRGFQAPFKARVAPVLLSNAKQAYLAIECMGWFDSRLTSTRVLLEGGSAQPAEVNELMANRDLDIVPGMLSSMLLADYEFVDIGMGSPRDTDNANVFSVGSIYGENSVRIGNIADSGTKQVFRRTGHIRTSGDQLWADPYSVTFLDTAAADEQTPPLSIPSNTVIGRVDETGRPAEDSRNYYEESGQRIVVGSEGRTPRPPFIEYYERHIQNTATARKIDLANQAPSGTSDSSGNFAGGAFLATQQYKNPYTTGDFEAVVVNFGRPGYLNGETEDDPVQYETSSTDPNLNQRSHFLYVKGKPLVIWGCPDRDVIIYCDKDIYIAGDFNQSWYHHQTYTNQSGDAGRADEPEIRYIDPVRFMYDKSGTPSTLMEMERACEGFGASTQRRDHPTATASVKGTEERKLAFVVSASRVWLDYRFPSRSLANELIPWIQFRLARALYLASGTGDPAATQEALKLITCPGDGDFSKRDTWFGSGEHPISADVSNVLITVDASNQPSVSPAANDFLVNDLKLPNPSNGYQKAVTLLQQISTPRIALKELATIAEQLMFQVLAVEEKTDKTNGIWKIPLEYYTTVFNAGSGSNLNTYKNIGSSTPDRRRTRLYLPEQTINGVLVDCARRFSGDTWYTTWEMSSPNSNRKIYSEIGNYDHTGGEYKKYLLFNGESRMIGRVFGSTWHLRNRIPDPPVKMVGLTYIPHKRKRIFDRGMPGVINEAFRVDEMMSGPVPNAYSVLVHRETVLTGDRGTAQQMFEAF